MDYKQCAAEILKFIGGDQNVVNVEHCSTRLRFTLADDSKADQEKLSQVNGVLKVILKPQVQVVIGGSVIEVYDELMKMITSKSDVKANNEKKTLGQTILEYLVGIFQPLVPVMAGAGILKSILILLNATGILTDTSDIYQVLISISDATFFFMPMMVAYTTATKLNINKMVAVAATGVMLLPNMTDMLTKGMTFAGFPLKAVTYNSQVFPAILCTLFLALMEKKLNKVTPKFIRTFFVPMVALAVTVPVTLMFLGPLGLTIGQGLATVIMFLYAHFGFIAVGLVACILPLMVSTGMHKAMIPYVVSSLGSVGYEILYNSASLAHNISESGACFAIAIKSKDEEMKSIAASSGVSALMGITEPALYGITLQNKTVLRSVMISSGCIGAFLGLVGLKAFVAVGPGLASITMFVDADNSMNIVYAIIGLICSLVLSFVLTFIFWKDEKAEEMKVKEEVMKKSDEEITLAKNTAELKTGTTNSALIDGIYSPADGEIINLADVNDEMFSQKVLGEGVAIVPTVGKLFAPCDGTVKMVFETKHAIGIETNNGSELLFHVGLDTVQLDGKYFDAKVSAGDKVKKGDLLLEFDINAIKAEGYDITTPIICTNSNGYFVDVNDATKANKSGLIMTTERR